VSDDPIADYFNAASDDEKQEAFDASTTSLILRQIGVPAKRVTQLQHEYGPAYGLSWLTETLGLSVDLWSTRIFDYNINDVFLAPRKSPVLAAYDEHVKDADPDLPHYMVFKAFKLGRLVAMSEAPTDRTYICARQGENGVYVALFQNLFLSIFGEHDL